MSYYANDKIKSLYMGDKKIIKVFKGTELVFNGSDWKKLYIPLSFLSNNNGAGNTPYVDLGITPCEQQEISMPFNLKTASGSAYLFGARNGQSGGNYYIQYWNGTSNTRCFFTSATGAGAGDYITLNKASSLRVLINGSSRKCVVGSKTFTGTVPFSECDKTYCLFSYNNNGNVPASTVSWNMQVSYVQISNYGELVLDAIPCKRISDGVVGFVNRVNGEFIAPIGGTLTAGNELTWDTVTV